VEDKGKGNKRHPVFPGETTGEKIWRQSKVRRGRVAQAKIDLTQWLGRRKGFGNNN